MASNSTSATRFLFAPCDDGTGLPFWNSLDRTVDALAELLGREEAERYRAFSKWSTAAMGVLGQTENGPPPSLRSLASLADLTLGAEGARLMQALFAPATAVTEAALGDDRLRGPLDHWAAHSQQPPQAPGTGAGALFLAASHGSPASRPVGGSRGTVDALVRCLEDARRQADLRRPGREGRDDRWPRDCGGRRRRGLRSEEGGGVGDRRKEALPRPDGRDGAAARPRRRGEADPLQPAQRFRTQGRCGDQRGARG